MRILSYPENTKGSKIVRAMRKNPNSLTREERADYLKKAMTLIYGEVGNAETN